MPSFSLGFLLSLLTLTSASPFPSFLFHSSKSDNQPSVLPRQAADGQVQAPPGITITGDIPPIVCATPGRTQLWSPDQVKSAITLLSDSLGTFSPADAKLENSNAGIDPAMPPTFAAGCDTTKPMFWGFMENGKGDTDIVVVNMDVAAKTAAFCAVMTNADEPKGEKGQYHVCNKQ
ncbi:MAG: hypothetical protein Q9219_003408 [cf. Caloplaca sp. 3 TL-2023]